MVKLVKFHSDHFNALNYKLNKAQADFTADIDYCINQRRDQLDPLKTLVTVLCDEKPVGFFVLDSGIDKLALTNNPASILVRSFSINPAYQGRGIGSEAMQLAAQFVKAQLPTITEIVLSVNFKNHNAYRAYLKAGYVDTNKTITGQMGGQNILSKIIKS